MMKLLKLMMFGIVVFALAAGGSWFARTRQHASADQTAGEHGNAAHDEHEGLPVVVRPRMLTPEDILRNAMSLKNQEDKLNQREQAAQQQEYRLGLVQADLQQEQKAIV